MGSSEDALMLQLLAEMEQYVQAGGQPMPQLDPANDPEDGAIDEDALSQAVGNAPEVASQPVADDDLMRYFKWGCTVDYDAADPSTAASSRAPPFLSRLLRPANALSSEAVVEAVERYLMPEGRLAPVTIYTGAVAGPSLGWLSLYQYKRRDQSRSSADAGPSSSAGRASGEEIGAGATYVPSGYAQFCLPTGSKARNEMEAFKAAYIAFKQSEAGKVLVGGKSMNLPKEPAGDQVNLAHVVWRYFHREDSDRPLIVTPERYAEIVRFGKDPNWTVSDPGSQCRRLPLGLQISHQGEAYDNWEWSVDDIHPDYRSAFDGTAKRSGVKGSKDIVWGANPGYKIEVSEAEDIMQQTMRQACATLGLMWRSADTGEVISGRDAGKAPVQCPHAVHGFPCYGPRPAALQRNDWPDRDTLTNNTTRSQIAMRGVAQQVGMHTVYGRQSGTAAIPPASEQVTAEAKTPTGYKKRKP